MCDSCRAELNAEPVDPPIKRYGRQEPWPLEPQGATAANGIALLVLAANAVAVGASFLPWARDLVMEHTGWELQDGQFSVGLAVIAGFFALLRLAGGLSLTAFRITQVLAGGLMIALVVLELAHIDRYGLAEPMYGLYVLLGAAFAVALLPLFDREER